MESLCKYANKPLCDEYQTAMQRNDEDSALQVDEVCTDSTRYFQNCYKKAKALEQSSQGASSWIFNHGRMFG